jgi:hypothetical protein
MVGTGDLLELDAHDALSAMRSALGFRIQRLPAKAQARLPEWSMGGQDPQQPLFP